MYLLSFKVKNLRGNNKVTLYFRKNVNDKGEIHKIEFICKRNPGIYDEKIQGEDRQSPRSADNRGLISTICCKQSETKIYLVI